MVNVPDLRVRKWQTYFYLYSLSKIKLHKYIIHNVFTDMGILIFNKDEINVITQSSLLIFSLW